MVGDPQTDMLAAAYFKLLTGIDWSDRVLVAGLREGLNKFLSNAHLAAYRGANKYHKTHYVSLLALERLGRRQYSGLVWEHLVPKARYIQEPCELRARQGTLSVEVIQALLVKYWLLATVTKEEDSLLRRREMPGDWDRERTHARYAEAGIVLVSNPYFQAFGHPSYALPGPTRPRLAKRSGRARIGRR